MYCLRQPIIASGVSCLVPGSADPVFHQSRTRQRVTYRGEDGSLGSDKDNLLLTRTERGAVSSVIRSRFSFRFSDEGQYNLIWQCPVLFFIQCVTQIFISQMPSNCLTKPCSLPRSACPCCILQPSTLLVGQREDPSEDLTSVRQNAREPEIDQVHVGHTHDRSGVHAACPAVARSDGTSQLGCYTVSTRTHGTTGTPLVCGRALASLMPVPHADIAWLRVARK